ncbi:hypothetical protein AKJ16_DCAP00817 [Drosera capensis]
MEKRDFLDLRRWRDANAFCIPIVLEAAFDDDCVAKDEDEAVKTPSPSIRTFIEPFVLLNRGEKRVGKRGNTECSGGDGNRDKASGQWSNAEYRITGTRIHGIWKNGDLSPLDTIHRT